MGENGFMKDAADHFNLVADFSFGDAERQRLRYHLLRLTGVGLTDEDVEDLSELGRLAFQESDVTKQVAKIKRRAGASPVARVIASIVESARSVPGGVSLKAVLLGAVLGAYTGLQQVSGMDRSAVAALGAIGGAVAVSTRAHIEERIHNQSWADYLRMDR